MFARPLPRKGRRSALAWEPGCSASAKTSPIHYCDHWKWESAGRVVRSPASRHNVVLCERFFSTPKRWSCDWDSIDDARSSAREGKGIRRRSCVASDYLALDCFQSGGGFCHERSPQLVLSVALGSEGFHAQFCSSKMSVQYPVISLRGVLAGREGGLLDIR